MTWNKPTAYHEAGHAIVALEFGAPIDRLYAGPGFGCTYLRDSVVLPPSQEVVFALAGKVAERVYYKRSDFERTVNELEQSLAAVPDRERAEQLLSQMDASGDLDELIREHEEKIEISLLKRWPTVQSLAELLCQKGELNAAEILEWARRFQGGQ